MPRRPITLALVALAAVLATGGEQAGAQASRPNVVVVMTDDQVVKDTRVMKTVKRQLARKGTTFRNFFATTPRCCPSRASFLTGQYSHNHGVRGPRNVQAESFRRFNDSGTLPVALERAGYRTGYVGKYLNGYGDKGASPRYVPPGWDDWRSPVKGTTTRQFDYVLSENRKLRRYGHRRRDYQADVYARKAASFIGRAAKGSKPFFLTVAPTAPHGERGVGGLRRDPRPAPRHKRRFEGKRLPKPPSFNERNVRDKPSFVRRVDRLDRSEQRQLREEHQDRLASLLAVDDLVGKLIARLRKTGELGRTVIFFTSDNGRLQGQHRLTKKSVLYEESVEVPLIVRGPGFPGGARRRQLTGNIDLAPTILDLAGADPLRKLDGISLLPLAKNGRRERGRDILFENALSSAIRTRRHVYMEHPRKERELYVLRGDRFQLESRHRDRKLADVRRKLARRLDQLRRCAGESCR
jgi:N-acetylglucosamine-6-sulfatase